MATAEEVLYPLKETGKVITAIIRNFAKDSASRITPTYYQERLSRTWTAHAKGYRSVE